MSDYENYVGTLKPINMNGLSLNEKCAEILKKKYNTEFDENSYYENELDQLKEVSDDKYYANLEDEQLFKVKKKSVEDISYIKKNKDGSYDFVVSYYNGGTYFDEVITEAIEEDKNKQKKK